MNSRVEPGMVIAVNLSATHTVTKPNRESVRLLEGLGVEGDARMGTTVKHVMAVVAAGGEVRPGDRIHVELPQEPRRALEPV